MSEDHVGGDAEVVGDLDEVAEDQLSRVDDLLLEDESYRIDSENNYKFDSSFYHFSLKSPIIPERVLSYNLGIRELEVIF